MNTKPLLSIVIPLLEPDSEFYRCLACIDAVGFHPEELEIVVVTPTANVERLSETHPTIKVFPERRRGIYGAMNDGILASTGDYLYFLGKDDMVLPNFRDALNQLATERPYLLSCDVYWGSDGRYSGRPSMARLLVKNLCHQGIFYSKLLLLEHGPYVRKMRVQADHFLNIKVLGSAKDGEKISYLRKPVAFYSGSGFSSSHRDSLFWVLYPLILEKYVGRWAAVLVKMRRSLRRIKS
jgi:glycosyltransferase involved in cell wall biosynthesis